MSPKNILLDNNLSCVLTDLGNSVANNETGLIDEIKFGTKRYNAPEVLDGTLEPYFENLCQCEIYSFALISWEVLICVTGKCVTL